MASVIVSTRNRSSNLKNTLLSFARITAPSNIAWEIIVVDNLSTDDTENVVCQCSTISGLAIKYAKEESVGHSYARNKGILEAKGQILDFTDDDCIVEPIGFLRSHGNFQQIFSFQV